MKQTTKRGEVCFQPMTSLSLSLSLLTATLISTIIDYNFRRINKWDITEIPTDPRHEAVTNIFRQCFVFLKLFEKCAANTKH